MAIKIKSEREIEIMRRSGKILAKILTHLQTLAKPGVTTSYLDKIAEEIIQDHNALPSFKGYQGYPATLCTSINDEVVHTFPSSRELKEGDILTLDCGVYLEGFHTDSATTFAIGETDPQKIEFIENVRSILYEAIKLVKPGAKIGEIGHLVSTKTKEYGYHVIKELIGHGIGREMHEAPEVPNFGKITKGPSLKPGMTFCIEPIIGYSTSQIHTEDNGWGILTRDGGLACQQEHTILVTQNGHEVLTRREEENSLN